MKKSILIVICCILLVCVCVPAVAFAETNVEIKSREAVLMSADGQVLFEKNATEKRPIASMTKIMTLLCIYDSVDEGKIKLSDDVVVSARAASMGGSQVFLDANATYKAENLVKSIIICSANDSCVAMAEHICGSVESFVECMNRKGEELGLVATHFENCTGLPHVSQFSCARDVAVMFSKLIAYPHYFECANIWMEDFVHPGGRVTGMTNTNKLVRYYDGCDGGKTGFTNEAMHCLAATAKRGETRVISVVVGAPDSKIRFKEVSDMFNYAFANYQNKVYLDVDSKLDAIAVNGGKSNSVEIAPAGKLFAFGKKGAEQCTVIYETVEELRAPIEAGQKVGCAKLMDGNGNVVGEVDLVTKCSVESKSYWNYIQDIIG